MTAPITETKSPFASTTLWGATFLLLSFLSMQFFGVEITAEEQADAASKAVTVIESIMGAIGLVMVFIGRFKANTQVKF